MADLTGRLVEALSHHQRGDIRGAERGYADVLAEAPGHGAALYLYGALTLLDGRATTARDLLERAITARPTHADSRFVLGNALLKLGDHAGAVAAYRALLDLDPHHCGALVNLANALREMGDTAGAIAACREAVAVDPTLAGAHASLGAALVAVEAVGEAVAAYRTALALAPNLAAAHAGLAAALLRYGEAEAAVAAADAAHRLAPQDAEPLIIRASARTALGRPGAAAADLRTALDREPGNARAQLNLGNALADLGRLEDAIVRCRQAIVLAPELTEAHASLGFLLTQTGDYAGAITACDEAIRLRPDFAQAHWNQGIAYLLTGDYARGWCKYEWRRRHDRYGRAYRAPDGERWMGGPASGRRLLVYAEQGLGDTIQFGRYLPLLAASGAAVTLACDPRLRPLFETGPARTDCVARDDAFPPCDLWVDQMSLPHLFDTRVRTIPTPEGYLRSPMERVAAWRERLARASPPSQLKVGLVWGGNVAHSNDANRSVPPGLLAPVLAVAGARFFPLQVGRRSRLIADHPSVESIADNLSDFGETAAALANLDLLISADTSTAHLGGALGIPTWIMLPHAPDWRWLPAWGETSPWYRSVRLFRQARRGDWAAVTARIADALRDRVAEHARSPQRMAVPAPAWT